jgi:transcriptional regulator with XRE-family HTH domain
MLCASLAMLVPSPRQVPAKSPPSPRQVPAKSPRCSRNVFGMSSSRHSDVMDDQRVGAAFRAVRVRRGWRQQDVAERAHVARSVVTEIEHGHFGSMALRSVRAVAAALDVRLDLVARWRGGELDRLLSARHSALHESVAAEFESLSGWRSLPEVSFSFYGERGVIDLLAFHAASGCLLVIELKTEIVDVNELIGNLDRKTRLGVRIAAERGLAAQTVSRWVIVSRHKTNQRRIEAHRSMLRAAFPLDGHAMRGWLARPSGSVSALSMWSSVAHADAGPTRSQRVRGRSATSPRA